MSFSPAFTYSQTAGLPSKINLVDSSTGSDGAITGRRVYLAKFDGSFLVPVGTSTQYVVWAYSASSIIINALDKDYAILITVQWLDTNGIVLYDKTQLVGFTLYNKTFSYQLTQWLSGNAILLADNNFWEEKNELDEAVDSGDQAILLATDIQGAQQCYDHATRIRINSQYNFNANS